MGSRKRDQYSSTIQVRPEDLVGTPVGTMFLSYEWVSKPTEHRLSDLTPDVDMLRYSHRYALCGFGPIYLNNGCKCICDSGSGAIGIRHCQRCERIWDARV